MCMCVCVCVCVCMCVSVCQTKWQSLRDWQTCCHSLHEVCTAVRQWELVLMSWSMLCLNITVNAVFCISVWTLSKYLTCRMALIKCLKMSAVLFPGGLPGSLIRVAEKSCKDVCVLWPHGWSHKAITYLVLPERFFRVDYRSLTQRLDYFDEACKEIWHLNVC